jgi:two-component system LytT family response regulator
LDPIRIIIADDEPPARAKIRRFLAGGLSVPGTPGAPGISGEPGAPAIAIVAEAGSGLETIAAVERTRPDLLFLDVQMPEPDGFGVLTALDPATLPRVIFTTAYDEYAVRAFEVHAIDYLLKPFDEERFQKSLRRAVAEIGRGTKGYVERGKADPGSASASLDDRSAGTQPGAAPANASPGSLPTSALPWEERLQRLLDEAQTRGRPLERILVRRGEEATLLRTAEITWIEAAGNYSRLHTADGSHLIRGTLSGLEARLDPNRFARIHRSHIVNLDQVRSLHPWSHGDWLVRLQDGTELMLSRRYRDRLPFDSL